ncbi:MAG: D-3-phosphoglycerate dehydrogenase (EC [uncultured Caballeronia sp.]|nr:MAG: D-3-phosphoglycerate dehydrogenase (EC [uncultured Caballeronia sp.]
MTKLVLISRDYDMSALAPAIVAAAPELQVHSFGAPDAGDAQVAVCWNPSAGALHFHRQFDQVLANQRGGVWRVPEQTLASDCMIGVMGLGEIGARVAIDLLHAGFTVKGWARNTRTLPGIHSFSDRDALPAFLSGVDILVCLLPLTSETRGLLNAEVLRQLNPGAKPIHVGRGEHLVMDALFTALSDGHLGGAIVDVFPNEPLPPDDPLWCHPKLIVTRIWRRPSRASKPWLADRRKRAAPMRGESLNNQVDVGQR